MTQSFYRENTKAQESHSASAIPWGCAKHSECPQGLELNGAAPKLPGTPFLHVEALTSLCHWSSSPSKISGSQDSDDDNECL